MLQICVISVGSNLSIKRGILSPGIQSTALNMAIYCSNSTLFSYESLSSCTSKKSPFYKLLILLVSNFIVKHMEPQRSVKF